MKTYIFRFSYVTNICDNVISKSFPFLSDLITQQKTVPYQTSLLCSIQIYDKKQMLNPLRYISYLIKRMNPSSVQNSIFLYHKKQRPSPGTIAFLINRPSHLFNFLCKNKSYQPKNKGRTYIYKTVIFLPFLSCIYL